MIGRRLAVVVLGTAFGMLAREAIADDAACQAVLDAVIKQATIPVHQKISIESAAAPGKVLQSEMIRTGDTLYMQVRGQWTSRPYDGQKAANDARQAMQKADHSCTRVRSEAVDGQPTDLFSVEAKTASGGTELTDLDFPRERIAAAPTHRDARAGQRQRPTRRAFRLRQRDRANERPAMKVRNRTFVCARMHNFVMG